VSEPLASSVEASAATRRRPPWQASFLVLGAIWGCSFWWIKVGLRAMTPVDVAFVRLAAGAGALLLIAAVTRTRLPRRVSTWRHLFVLSLLINSAPFTLFAYGETHISAVLAGLINSLTPLTTLVAVLVLFRQERATRAIITGLFTGFIGVLVVIGVWRGFGRGQLLGVGACLAAVLCYGVGFPYARHHLGPLKDPPISLAAGQVLCGTLQLLPFALLSGHVHHHPPAASFFALAALGVLGTGVAYILNFDVVSHAPATIASSVTYLTPLFAVIAGTVFLRESLSWNEPIGAVLILGGAALAQGRFRRRASPHDRSPARPGTVRNRDTE
jgi:drug/metabolite transporter (DMT)-like permease